MQPVWDIFDTVWGDHGPGGSSHDTPLVAALLAIEDGSVSADGDDDADPDPADPAPSADEASSIATTVPEQTPDEPVESLPLAPALAEPVEPLPSDFIESQWRLEVEPAEEDAEIPASQVEPLTMEPITITDSLPLEGFEVEAKALSDSAQVESPSRNGEPSSPASAMGAAPAGHIDGMTPSPSPTKETLCLNFQ